MYFLFSFKFFMICSVDVKNKNKNKKYSESECVVCIFYGCFFYDKIANNKEEFNILICSWLRIMNLHVSRISNIR